MRIGTMFLGEVDAVDSQSVQTKFFVFGVPLFPISSFFFVDSGERRGMEIALHGKSVVAGYVRVGLGVWFLIAVIQVMAMSSYRRGPGDYVYPAVVAAAALASLFVIGRLSAAEKAKRRLLYEATGLAADPSILPLDVRLDIESRFRWALEASKVALHDPNAWRGGGSPYREQSGPMDGETLRKLYVYARYTGVNDPAWRAAAEELWLRTTSGTVV